ncbi:MAG TPA: imelysin family protein [Noviherbaspirillum sp.]|nr:imelysin family protein [Noviherbaspirillum sp.]
MRRIILSLLFAALGSHVQASDIATNPDEKLPKSMLFHHLAQDVMLPLTQQFAQAAAGLADTAKAFCATPHEADLAEVRTAWRTAQAAWQPLEMLQLGPIIERRTQQQVNAWPLRLRLLERLLAEEQPVQVAQVDALGAAGKGFPALEYLLFTPGKTDTDTTHALSGKSCSALQALAAHIGSEANGLATAWREPNGGFARQLAEAGNHPQDGAFATADQALSDIANLLIAGLDAVKSRKLGKALEQDDNAAALERIESWRSGTSLDHLRANLRGFELVFFGAGTDGIGLDDYLVGLSRPVLPRLVRQDLHAAQTALAAIRPPLRTALTSQRPQIEALHKALTQLQRRMEDDIADALKVDLGFNTSDGD